MNRYKTKIAERDRKLRNSIITKCILTSEIETIDELVKICNEFDLLICGSDQIWNPNWYDKFYSLIILGLRRIEFHMLRVWVLTQSLIRL